MGEGDWEVAQGASVALTVIGIYQIGIGFSVPTLSVNRCSTFTD